MEFIYIFGRLIFSLGANIYQKKLSHQGLHPFFIVATTYFVLSLLAAPLLGVVEISQLSHAFWLDAFLASLFDVGGWMFLVMSLSKTELSVFGPLNAYKVVASMLLAIVFLNEIPSLQGFIGVLVIIAGSYFLTPSTGDLQTNRILSLLKDKGVQARFLSILLFAIGTIFLKKSVILGGALATMVFWSLMGFLLVLLSNQLFLTGGMKSNLQASNKHLPTIIAIGAMVFVMQYFTLLLLANMMVAYALALFQLGMVLQVFAGYKVFNEKHITRKLLACSVMMAGSILVLMA
ncbi:EamA family transporter [Methylotenera sp.]|uniref:EamA family transporter n=1 Tax=Methylotenera sp. TaxID=2051956 RepID=UPI0024890CAE|nr:EamA family transporter [Methylotenera sp.]MDI1298411.1 EamA family transporter [Methylotenera sp.]